MIDDLEPRRGRWDRVRERRARSSASAMARPRTSGPGRSMAGRPLGAVLGRATLVPPLRLNTARWRAMTVGWCRRRQVEATEVASGRRATTRGSVEGVDRGGRSAMAGSGGPAAVDRCLPLGGGVLLLALSSWAGRVSAPSMRTRATPFCQAPRSASRAICGRRRAGTDAPGRRGAISSWRPRRPAETKTVSWSRAERSTTTGSGRREPSGLIPPTT